MGLDIRLPIGLLFGSLGLILTAVGLVVNAEIYVRSDGININLWWGLTLLVFGIVMGIMGQRGTAAMRTALSEAEGRAIERIEHATGAEH